MRILFDSIIKCSGPKIAFVNKLYHIKQRLLYQKSCMHRSWLCISANNPVIRIPCVMSMSTMFIVLLLVLQGTQFQNALFNSSLLCKSRTWFREQTQKRWICKRAFSTATNNSYCIYWHIKTYCKCMDCLQEWNPKSWILG